MFLNNPLNLFKIKLSGFKGCLSPQYSDSVLLCPKMILIEEMSNNYMKFIFI